MSFETPADQAPDKLVGTTLGGRYTILNKLGEGGMGCVYVAQQKLGQSIRRVAVKTLHPHLSHDPSILARFEREVGTVSELQHPNTIQVFDYGKTDDGTLYIVMEFVEGRSVAEILEKDGPMEPSRVEKILTQVCGSLAEAHGRGIVHRDLKPDNIVLCNKAGQTDWVEVLDFGIAKRGGEEDKNEAKLTQQGMVLGTPPYMSPEQFTGKPVDTRSDIYSLGIMTYEMLTGRLPFAGNTAWEWATAHMTAQPVSIDLTPAGPHIPPRMKAAITKALAKAPEDRYPNVSAFLAAFNGTSADAMAPVHATNVDSPSARGRTEVGTPMAMPPGAYSPPPPAYGQPPAGGQAGYGPPPGAGGYGTPAAGNHAMAAAVPAGPGPRAHGGGGGNKGMLLAIAGVIGVLSIGAVVFAMKGQSSKSNAGGLDLGAIDAGSSVPATDLTPAATASAAAETPPDPAANAPLPELNKPHSAPPSTPKAPAHTEPPKAGETHPTTPTTTPTVPPHTGTTPPVVTAPPATPPAANAEPKACANARLMYSVGNRREGDTLAKMCSAQGGHL